MPATGQTVEHLNASAVQLFSMLVAALNEHADNAHPFGNVGIVNRVAHQYDLFGVDVQG